MKRSSGNREQEYHFGVRRGQMLVILLQDVEGVGKENDVVNVDADYAHGYLIANGMAIKANEILNTDAKVEDKHPAYELWGHKHHDEARHLADQLSAITITVLAKDSAGATAQDIANAIKRRTGIVLGAGKLHLKEPLKPGTHLIPVRVHDDLEFDLRVDVVEKVGVK